MTFLRARQVHRARGLRLGLLLVLLLTLAPAQVRAQATASMTSLSYTLDWSAVPSWVVHREITLVVTVGAVEDAVVLADGVPVRHTLDRAAGVVRVTTGAAQVEVRVWGGDPAQAGFGAVRKAALRDDKRWAYSLTMDDGYESQAVTAPLFLDPYGYAATIAVAGDYLTRHTVQLGSDIAVYATPEQLAAVLAKGWGLSNHTYSHPQPSQTGTQAQMLADVLRDNQTIMAAVPGYVPRVFTAPWTNTAYIPVITGNVATLGLRLTQVAGYEAKQVDAVAGQPEAFSSLVMGRTGIMNDSTGHEQARDKFLDMHNKPAGQHWWLSLHTHAVIDQCDCVETSTSFFYETYGAGGSDEAWMAPSEVVQQYLAARDHVVVTPVAGTPAATTGEVVTSGLAAAPRARAQATNGLQTVVFQNGNGIAGYDSATDTYIDMGHPTEYFPLAGSMYLRTGGDQAGLLRFDLSKLPAGARILSAQLELQTSGGSGNFACLSAYPLLRSWNQAQANWNQASTGQGWGLPGAKSAGSDRAAAATDVRRRLETVGDPATLDLTAAVQGWVDNPASNHGVLLSLERSNVSTYFSVYSGDYPQVAKHPRLVVAYLEPGQATLSGQVQFTGRAAAPSPVLVEPITVTLKVPGVARTAYSAVLTTDAEGRFSLGNVAAGVYDVYVRSEHSLWAVTRNVIVPAQGASLSVGALRAGDFNSDGLVGADDLEVLRASYRTVAGDAAYDARADLTRDGAVNLYDLSIFALNYGRQAEMEP